MEIIHITSLVMSFLASIVPVYFAIKIRDNREVLTVSALLSAALLAYGLHGIMELWWQGSIILILEICFVAAVIGTIISYMIFRKKRYNAIIGGMFGLAMLTVFGTWLMGEIIESLLEDDMTVIYLNSSAMIGFAIFIFARFFLLRRTLHLETRRIVN